MMVAYTLKDKGRDAYSNVHGGTDWNDTQTAAWVQARYED